ncbi:hypothetical protein COT83_01705 [Candidatus Peregrinibacteria bacterium CG10_big_fil_rev_8_21_14_0_10_44_7]|nr:MAG: hypothetical protein AUK45_05315 [Candidatus Peregrinibacteria bacterium CG2_30_44_17]PIS04229.1 MAG: hypothetical protein COT83_01705 [Candidatus Peregrinibacteria bacterium CG10_big_fil_rev_8_21_14_0_10_44_7]
MIFCMVFYVNVFLKFFLEMTKKNGLYGFFFSQQTRPLVSTFGSVFDYAWPLYVVCFLSARPNILDGGVFCKVDFSKRDLQILYFVFGIVEQVFGG